MSTYQQVTVQYKAEVGVSHSLTSQTFNFQASSYCSEVQARQNLKIIKWINKGSKSLRIEAMKSKQTCFP